MKAWLTLLVLFIGGSAEAFACNMNLETRSDQIADYVRAGQLCLETPPDGLRFAPEIEQGFVERINAARRAKGLSHLQVRAALQPAARFHSLDMSRNEFFEHQGPDGRKAFERIAAFDRTLLAQSTAENIAILGPTTCFDHNDQPLVCETLPGFAPPTPEFVVDDLHQRLIQSPGHRKNILAADSTHVAIGVARTSSGFWVTQLFTNQVGTLSTPLPLRMRRGDASAVSADLADWGFGGVSLKGQDQTLHTFEAAPFGEMQLIVRGKTEREDIRGRQTYTITEWLDLSGPSLSFSAPREN